MYSSGLSTIMLRMNSTSAGRIAPRNDRRPSLRRSRVEISSGVKLRIVRSCCLPAIYLRYGLRIWIVYSADVHLPQQFDQVGARRGIEESPKRLKIWIVRHQLDILVNLFADFLRKRN